MAKLLEVVNNRTLLHFLQITLTQKPQVKLGRPILTVPLRRISKGRAICLTYKTLNIFGRSVQCECERGWRKMSHSGMATYSFTGKRVLVTGGANGVGKAIVTRFLETGATVIAVDRDAQGLEKLKSEIPQANLVALELDLSDWRCTNEAIQKVLPIHHLVNNVGIVIQIPILDVTESMIDALFSVNFKAAFNLSQIFARGIRDHGIKDGTIVNISSVIDRLTPQGFSAYSCSKAALSMLSKCLASELGQFKIRSNTIRPDMMKTNMFEEYVHRDPAEADALIKMNQEKSKLKKVLEPADLCQLVLFLSSQDSGMITGEDIIVDGGSTLF